MMLIYSKASTFSIEYQTARFISIHLWAHLKIEQGKDCEIVCPPQQRILDNGNWLNAVTFPPTCYRAPNWFSWTIFILAKKAWFNCLTVEVCLSVTFMSLNINNQKFYSVHLKNTGSSWIQNYKWELRVFWLKLTSANFTFNGWWKLENLLTQHSMNDSLLTMNDVLIVISWA